MSDDLLVTGFGVLIGYRRASDRARDGRSSSDPTAHTTTFNAKPGMLAPKNNAAEAAKTAAVKKVGAWLEEMLPEDERDEDDGGKAPPGKETSVIVNQLQCQEAGCPDVELVMTLLRAKPRPKLTFKIFKAAVDLSREELETALRQALAEEEGPANKAAKHDHDHDEHGHGHDEHGHGHAHDGKCCDHDHSEDAHAKSDHGHGHDHGHDEHASKDHGHVHDGNCCDHDHSEDAHAKSDHAHGHDH